MGSREMVEFIGEILRNTEKAIFFKDEMQEKEEAVWLPLSQIKILNRDQSTDPEQAEIAIPEWLAKQKGLT